MINSEGMKLEDALQVAVDAFRESLDNEAVTAYCDLYRTLRDGGENLPDADLLIAATAISNGLPLKTGDKHFERLRSLGLEVQSLTQ